MSGNFAFLYIYKISLNLFYLSIFLLQILQKNIYLTKFLKILVRSNFFLVLTWGPINSYNPVAQIAEEYSPLQYGKYFSIVSAVEKLTNKTNSDQFYIKKCKISGHILREKARHKLDLPKKGDRNLLDFSKENSPLKAPPCSILLILSGFQEFSLYIKIKTFKLTSNECKVLFFIS